MRKIFLSKLTTKLSNSPPENLTNSIKNLKYLSKKSPKFKTRTQYQKMRPAASRQKIKNMKSSNSRLQQPYGFQKTKNIQKPSQKKIKKLTLGCYTYLLFVIIRSKALYVGLMCDVPTYYAAVLISRLKTRKTED